MSDRIQELEKQIYDLNQELFRARAEGTPETVSPEFAFETAAGTVRLADLFGNKNELVLIHNMGKSCSYCTMWADVLEGSKKHLETRCALVLVSPDSPEDQRKLAAARGWTYRTVTDATKISHRRWGSGPRRTAGGRVPRPSARMRMGRSCGRVRPSSAPATPSARRDTSSACSESTKSSGLRTRVLENQANG